MHNNFLQLELILKDIQEDLKDYSERKSIYSSISEGVVLWKLEKAFLNVCLLYNSLNPKNKEKHEQCLQKAKQSIQEWHSKLEEERNRFGFIYPSIKEFQCREDLKLKQLIDDTISYFNKYNIALKFEEKDYFDYKLNCFYEFTTDKLIETCNNFKDNMEFKKQYKKNTKLALQEFLNFLDTLEWV